WPYLAAGTSLHLVEEAIRRDIPELIRWMVRAGITVSFLPTPLAELALDEVWPEATSLRAILTGGDRLRTRPPAGIPFRVLNNYGPSECAVVTTAAWVEGDGAEMPPI